MYQSATFKDDGTMVEANTGHLGILDDPKLCKRLSGRTSTPRPPRWSRLSPRPSGAAGTIHTLKL